MTVGAVGKKRTIRKWNKHSSGNVFPFVTFSKHSNLFAGFLLKKKCEGKRWRGSNLFFIIIFFLQLFWFSFIKIFMVNIRFFFRLFRKRSLCNVGFIEKRFFKIHFELLLYLMNRFSNLGGTNFHELMFCKLIYRLRFFLQYVPLISNIII